MSAKDNIGKVLTLLEDDTNYITITGDIIDVDEFDQCYKVRWHCDGAVTRVSFRSSLIISIE